jgi:hypothetical protein
MPQYLLNIMQPDGPPPPAVDLERVMADVAVLGQDMRDAGAFVFTGGLHPVSAATVVRGEGDDVLVTDGPFAEAKEHVGGFWIVDAPDLDAALAWARRATVATTLPIEVRPFQHTERA